jgi:hypothetical protein
VLAGGLKDIDVDGKDFVLAKEYINALAAIPDADATAGLERVAGRRALIKRGRFAEVQTLARDALKAQRKAGGA